MGSMNAPSQFARIRNCGRHAIVSTFASVASIAFIGLFSSAHAAQVTIVNLDSVDEGLNDPTSALPTGGNTGTTLGEQRLIALQYAADRWAELLRSPVEILVDARFNPMGGDALTAPVGFANTKSSHRDFVGAPAAETFYVAALANRLARTDLNPTNQDIRIRFNSDVDGLDALGPRRFYYGLDAAPGADIDFVTAALHELAHGLGFVDLADLEIGENRACPVQPEEGCTDAYLRNLRDETTTPAQLSDMDSQQRSSAVRNEPNLVWSGTSASGTAAGLTGGIDLEDRIILHAPATFAPAVSAVHVTTDVSPAQLMEPSYTGAIHDLVLASLMLRDTGWLLTPDTTTTTTTSTTTTSTSLPQGECGDPSGDGDITSTDALITLNAAVGLVECPLSVCDVDAGGTVTSTDAVRVLRFAVGEDLILDCGAG